MNILIVGRGKVGSNLCNCLSIQGHEISVISENEDDFAELSPDFDGYTNVGIVIDQDVLKRAGIETCDVVVAVTQNDNTNLMIVQLAKHIFGVENAYARVNDPKKEDVFSKMGVSTICPTNLTVDAFVSAICETDSSDNVSVGTHNLTVTKLTADSEMVGMRVSELSLENNETIIAVEHENKNVETIFLTNYEIVSGDVLIYAKFVD